MAIDLLKSFLPEAESIPSRPLTLEIGATFGPFYINFFATRPVLVGTYAVDPLTDVFTLANHGMVNGTMVQVTRGGSSTLLTDGLESGELYFVANRQGNTFQLSLTHGDIFSSISSVIDVTGSEPGRIYRAGVPYDMTDHRVWGWVKRRPTDDDDDLTLDLSPTIVGADLGFGYDWRVKFTKTSTQTFVMEPSADYWSLLLQFPDGTRSLLIENSNFNIKLPTTHPNLIS